MGEEFDPHEAGRDPRQEGYEEETEEIFEVIQNERGDQRIGQFLINAVRSRYKLTDKETIEQKIWSMEAPQLLETVKNYANGEYQ